MGEEVEGRERICLHLSISYHRANSTPSFSPQVPYLPPHLWPANSGKHDLAGLGPRSGSIYPVHQQKWGRLWQQQLALGAMVMKEAMASAIDPLGVPFGLPALPIKCPAMVEHSVYPVQYGRH
jgi:hypothetical protein